MRECEISSKELYISYHQSQMKFADNARLQDLAGKYFMEWVLSGCMLARSALGC